MVVVVLMLVVKGVTLVRFVCIVSISSVEIIVLVEALSSVIPGPRGEMEPGKQVELRERAFADDTGVALRDDSQIHRLFELFEEFEAVSGHKLNPEKTIGIRFGTAKQTPAPAQVGGRKVE